MDIKIKISVKDSHVNTIMRAAVCMVIDKTLREEDLLKMSKISPVYDELGKFLAFSEKDGARPSSTNEARKAEVSFILENRAKVEVLLRIADILYKGSHDIDLTYSEAKIVIEALIKYMDLIDEFRKRKFWMGLSQKDTNTLYLAARWILLKYHESAMIRYSSKSDFWEVEYKRARAIIDYLSDNKSDGLQSVSAIMEMIR
ncbi:MAG TPA: hypothetical protein PLQ69_08835 [Paludibacter sp.]|nr:hypothetical protein [Paludibacter sp.]HPM11547.1 hypothetical protein [Paludibacter sp.]